MKSPIFTRESWSILRSAGRFPIKHGHSEVAVSRIASILSICDDEYLRFTRELVLRSEGYKVVSLRSDEIQTIQGLGDFDVAILCRTVSSRRALEIAGLLRKAAPRIRLLRIESLETQIDSEYGMHHGELNSPGALLGAVKTLCDPKWNRPPESA